MSGRVDSFSIEQCRDEAAADALSMLGRETFIQTFGHLYKADDLDMFLRDNHSPENYRRLLLDPTYAVWTAHSADRELVGFAVAGPCDLPVPDMPDKAGELIRFYVLDKFQGMGLGQGLMDQVLTWLEARFDHLYLSVYAQNDGAQRLYRRYGFRKILDYFYMVGTHADPEIVMQRLLGPDQEGKA